MGLFGRSKKQPGLLATPPGPSYDPNSATNGRAWFKYADRAPALSAEQWCGLALAQVQAVVWDMPVNTLSIFFERDEAAEVVLNAWGITSTDECRGELLALLQGDADQDFAALRSRPDTHHTLVEAGLLDEPGAELPSVAAWNLSRVVHLARLCHDAGYLAEPEAWQWVGVATERASLAYESVVEFGDGLVVGRVFWTLATYTDEEDRALVVPQAQEFGSALAHLAHDDDSPWRTVPWPTRR